MTITASADTVALESTSSFAVVTGDGEPINHDAVPTGTEIFLDLPVDAPAGDTTSTVSLDGQVCGALPALSLEEAVRDPNTMETTSPATRFCR